MNNDPFRPATDAEKRAFIEWWQSLPKHPDTAHLWIDFLRERHEPESIGYSLSLLGSQRLGPDADVTAINEGGVAAYERALVGIDPAIVRVTVTAFLRVKIGGPDFYWPSPERMRALVEQLMGDRPMLRAMREITDQVRKAPRQK